MLHTFRIFCQTTSLVDQRIEATLPIGRAVYRFRQSLKCLMCNDHVRNQMVLQTFWTTVDFFAVEIVYDALRQICKGETNLIFLANLLRVYRVARCTFDMSTILPASHNGCISFSDEFSPFRFA